MNRTISEIYSNHLYTELLLNQENLVNISKACALNKAMIDYTESAGAHHE
jgi:hypothetical protein